MFQNQFYEFERMQLQTKTQTVMKVIVVLYVKNLIGEVQSAVLYIFGAKGKEEDPIHNSHVSN